jgi:hypothetical protein
MNEPLIAKTKEEIAFFRLAALEFALGMELIGLRRSRSPSAYSILKREYGFKGSKKKVLEQVRARAEQLIAEREQNS